MSTSEQPPAVWVLATDSLEVHEWADSDYGVIYNRLSGDTHLVSAFAAELLRLMDSCPTSSEMLARRFLDGLNTGKVADIQTTIDLTLRQLTDIDLVASIVT